jgi:hypothetical protein
MEECMRTYLRFTRKEFGAISRACRSIPLTEGSFAAFQSSLVRALALVHPGLARRVAAFRSYQVGILFEHLKGRDETSPGFTAAECEAMARVCGSVVLPPRFVASFRDALVGHFRDAQPDLADKLARLSEQEVAQLCERVRQRRR